MRAIFTMAWAEVRRRRLQSAVIVVMVALASATITLALHLLLESRSPYDRAFEAQHGAHLRVFYDARRVTPGQLASTPATMGASSSAGPWPSVYGTLLHRQSSDGQSRRQLDLVGRDSPKSGLSGSAWPRDAGSRRPVRSSSPAPSPQPTGSASATTWSRSTPPTSRP